MSNTEEPRQRHSALNLIITVIGVGLFVTFLILLSNVALLYMLLGALAIAGIGFLHYILWGSDLMRQAALEREKEEEEEA